MKRRAVVAVAAWLLGSALWVTDAVAAASPLALFEAPAAGADARAAGGAHGRATVRQRAVTARAGALTREDGSPALGAGDRLELNLFDDVSFTMTVTDVTRHLERGHSWSGTLDGVDLGTAVLAVHEGALVGQVVTPGAVYQIGHGSDGAQIVQQIDTAALPPEAPPVSTGQSVADAMRLGGESPDAAGDSAAQIDVMVLYTAAARTAAGGTAQIRAAIDLAVASANQAYANNNLVQRLRLVYAGETSLIETADFNATLNALTASPVVGWLRDVTRADLVSLIVNHSSPQFCGLGFLLEANSTAFAPNGFSVVERICATSNLTFAHELGHNMGAHHDVYVAHSEHTVFPYSHGWVDLVGVGFRTIMAYVDQCTVAGVSPCNRVQFFSTPNQTQAGRPLGNAATADNARTLGDTAANVANFRQALAPPVTITTGVNQSSFSVGQTLVASVGLASGGTAAGAADVYLGLLLPNNSAVFFTDVTITPTSGYVFGNILSFASYRPIATGVSLGTPFDASFPAFLSYQRSAGDPVGGLALFLLVTTPNALADGILSAHELLGASLTPFTFPAAALSDAP